MKYYIISKRTENDNTAEFGFGDFPKTYYFVSLVVDAETKRKAQNQAKKISPDRYMFGGIIFGLGWALAGACPGPMFTLVGAGFAAIIVVIVSSILGTFLYGLLKDKLPH